MEGGKDQGGERERERFIKYACSPSAKIQTVEAREIEDVLSGEL